jgi:hypothetical protein
MGRKKREGKKIKIGNKESNREKNKRIKEKRNRKPSKLIYIFTVLAAIAHS